MKLQIFSNESLFFQEALQKTLAVIKENLENKEELHIGLAGGTSPKKLYQALARENLPWEKIKFILVDERYVPEDDEESNAQMLRQNLFIPAGVPSQNQMLFNTQLSPIEACSTMAKKLETLPKPLFDLLILGAGKDGHIASLFEGDLNMESTDLAYTTEAPVGYATRQRLTLSLHALTQASHALLLLKGEGKQELVEALNGKGILPLTAIKKLMVKVPTEVLACLE